MKYFCTLLAFVLFQACFAQKNTHSLAFMGGISIKNTRYDYSVPLTLEYEYRYRKSGFSIGLQGRKDVSNYKSTFQSIKDFKKHCQAVTVKYRTFGISSVGCNYSSNLRLFLLSVPFSYKFYALSNKNVDLFLKTDLALNYQVYGSYESTFPKYDSSTGTFLDPGPFFEKRVYKDFRFDSYSYSLGCGVLYKLNKKLKLKGESSYQLNSDDYQMLLFQLGIVYKI